MFKIKEQVIEDKVTGIALVFHVTKQGNLPRLRLIGDMLPYGNRDFQFNKDGELVGTGVRLGKCALDRSYSKGSLHRGNKP